MAPLPVSGSDREARSAAAPTLIDRVGWAYVFLASAVWMRNGAFHTLALAQCGLAVLLLLSAFPDPARPPAAPEPLRPRRLLPMLLVLCALSISEHPGVQMQPGSPLWPYGLHLGTLAALIAGAVLRPAWAVRLCHPVGVTLLCALYLSAGLLLLRDSSMPHVDVFMLQQLGADDLLSGRNPYTQDYPNIYTPAETVMFFGRPLARLTHYPYPPLTLLLTLPGLLFGDVRIMMLLGQIGAGVALLVLARRASGSAPLSLGLLGMWWLHPRGLMVLEQCWTEPLVAAPLFAALACMLAKPAPRLLGVALGLVLAAKQYCVLLVPLLLWTPFLPRRRPLLVGLGVAALITLPFFLWDPRGFVDDVLLFQLQQPFRLDALSLPVLVFRLTHLRAPGALSLLGALLGGALAYRSRRALAGAHGLALTAALCFLGFFLFAKQAFANYYYFNGALLLAAMATGPARSAPG